MLLFMLFCFTISNLKLSQCINEKTMLNYEEIHNLEDSGDDGSQLADVDVVNSESNTGRGEIVKRAEAELTQSVDERVRRHEDDVGKQLNDKDGENDMYEKYEGVFGGFGDDTRSKRVKRMEEFL